MTSADLPQRNTASPKQVHSRLIYFVIGCGAVPAFLCFPKERTAGIDLPMPAQSEVFRQFERCRISRQAPTGKESAMTKDTLKDKLKPVAKLLFGDQKTMADTMRQTPQSAVRPVGMIVEDLCRIPDEAWASYAFSREPLNGKFTDAQRLELTRQAIACGQEYAERLTKQYGCRDPEKMARLLGVEVDFPDMPQNAERVLFAEFREPNRIHIYMDGVRRGRALLGSPGVPHALGGTLNIGKLLLGHELFHFVEEKYKKEIWTRTYRIELWAPRPLHNRSGVDVLGEIAAMAFTKALNGISYSPYVMDAFLVYGYSPETASALYEEMMEKAGRTPRMPESCVPEEPAAETEAQ